MNNNNTPNIHQILPNNIYIGNVFHTNVLNGDMVYFPIKI